MPAASCVATLTRELGIGGVTAVACPFDTRTAPSAADEATIPRFEIRPWSRARRGPSGCAPSPPGSGAVARPARESSLPGSTGRSAPGAARAGDRAPHGPSTADRCDPGLHTTLAQGSPPRIARDRHVVGGWPAPGRDAIRHPVEPRTQRFADSQRARLARQRQERRLEGVLRVVGVAESLAADVQDHRPVPPQQHFERRLVAIVHEPPEGTSRSDSPDSVPSWKIRTSCRIAPFVHPFTMSRLALLPIRQPYLCAAPAVQSQILAPSGTIRSPRPIRPDPGVVIQAR